jgi:hypothetical protein
MNVIVAVLLSGVVATRSVRCEPPYSHTMGLHFITAIFIHGAVSTRWTSLLTDAWDNWGYDEGGSTFRA